MKLSSTVRRWPRSARGKELRPEAPISKRLAKFCQLYLERLEDRILLSPVALTFAALRLRKKGEQTIAVTDTVDRSILGSAIVDVV
jgi:hypothetical protein